MGKMFNYAITKKRLVKFCSPLKKSGFNIHVNLINNSAVVQLLMNSFSKIDIDLRSTLYGEIVLAGGNTKMDGFPERFIK